MVMVKLRLQAWQAKWALGVSCHNHERAEDSRTPGAAAREGGEGRAGGSRGRPAGAPKGAMQVAWETQSPPPSRRKSPSPSLRGVHSGQMQIPPSPAPASKPSSGETVDSSSPSPLLPTPACRPGIARIPSASTQTRQGALPCTPSASQNFLGIPLQ